MHRIIDMKLNRPYILYIFICLWLLFLPSCTNHLWGKDFVVVIDAGHGGHDPGAIGKISKEKNINLNVALKVGNLIKRNCDDVKVIYTRSKDFPCKRLPRSTFPTHGSSGLSRKTISSGKPPSFGSPKKKRQACLTDTDGTVSSER